MTTETYIDLRKRRESGLLKQAVDKAKASTTAIRHRRYYRKALGSPSRVYKTPYDVLNDESMTTHEKQQILLSWRSEAFLLQAAEAEGFEGGEPCLSDDIEICLDLLHY